MTSPKEDFTSAVQEWKGGNSGVYKSGTTIARTQAEWEDLWNATNSNTYPRPKAPQMPEGKMAIGIFAGQISYPKDITVRSVVDNGSDLTVNWTAESASTMLCVMFEPYLLKWIDKSDKDVSFFEQATPRKTPSIDLKSLKRK